MSIYLFRKYWGKHKGRLFSLILSIILLVASAVFLVLNERAELRRRLHVWYDEGGNYYINIRNVTDEEEKKEIMELPYADRIGVVSVMGSFREGNSTYMVGCFENEEAANSQHFPMTEGRMPKKEGEAAMPEFLLNMLFPNTAVGDEITLNFEDLNGKGMEQTYRLSGIINNHTVRDDVEHSSHDGVTIRYNDMVKYPSPSVYIHKNNASGFEKYYNYYISPSDELYFSDEGRSMREEMLAAADEIIGKYESVSTVGMAHFYQQFLSGTRDNRGYAEAKETEDIKVVRTISLFMMVVAGISMFSGILSVMPKRVESLRLLRLIGMSKLRLFGIFITEFFLFWLIGSAAGVLAGCTIHELVLFFQRAVGIGAYHGYTAELVVEKLTTSPFIMPLLLSLLIATVSLVIPAREILTMSSYKKPSWKRLYGKAGSFGRAFSKTTGALFTLLLVFFSLSVVVCITLFVYCFYTQSGKGTSYFSSGNENAEANYYKANGADFKENGIDCGISVNTSNNDFRVLDGGYGITAEELKELEGRAYCTASGNYQAMVCYDKDEKYPTQLEVLNIPQSVIDRIKYEYCGYFMDNFNIISNISFRLINAELMEKMFGADPEDVVLVWDNGNFPYEVGEEVPVINYLCDDYSYLKVDSGKRFRIKITKQFNTTGMEEYVEGIPEGIGSREIVMTAEKAEELGFYFPEYDSVFLTFREKMNDRQIRDFISSTVKRHVSVVTIHELERKARLKRLSSSANSIMLFVLLFILNTISLWNLLRVNAGNNAEKFQIMHSLGIPWKRIRTMFIGNVVKATAAALILCTVFSIGAQRLISEKYDEYWSLLEEQQGLINNTGFPNTILPVQLSFINEDDPQQRPVYDITVKMEHLEKTYILKKELWLPSLTVPLLLIWAAVIISTMFCALTAAGHIKDESVQTRE